MSGLLVSIGRSLISRLSRCNVAFSLFIAGTMFGRSHVSIGRSCLSGYCVGFSFLARRSLALYAYHVSLPMCDVLFCTPGCASLGFPDDEFPLLVGFSRVLELVRGQTSLPRSQLIRGSSTQAVG